MHKKLITLWIIIFTIIIIGGFHIKIGGTSSGSEIVDNTTFVDDVGNLIKVNKKYDKIISLSSMHTENLYEIGAGDKIIGVDKKSNYPIDVSKLPHFVFDEDSDINRIIKLKPDLVIVDPDINRKHAGFVTRLETANLKVVSLKPDDFNEFDIYIKKLAMLTGNEKAAAQRLELFHKDLNSINKKAKTVSNEKNVFYESSEKGYLTCSKKSLPYFALNNINAKNIAESELSKKPDIKYDEYGLNNILSNKEKIDVYLTQVGGSNAGASIVSIKQKKKFKDIKAIEENHIYEMETLLIDNYTFRFVLGNYEMARAVYPEVFDSIEKYKNNDKLDRATFSEVVVKMLHAPIYVNTNSSYYNYKRFNHLYGNYEDVHWKDPKFNYIETATQRLYIKPKVKNATSDIFDKKGLITKADVANFLYILYDVSGNKAHENIKDSNDKIIGKVVDSGLMKLDNGYFYPEKTYTNKEFIDFMDDLLENNKVDLVGKIK